MQDKRQVSLLVYSNWSYQLRSGQVVSGNEKASNFPFKQESVIHHWIDEKRYNSICSNNLSYFDWIRIPVYHYLYTVMSILGKKTAVHYQTCLVKQSKGPG